MSTLPSAPTSWSVPPVAAGVLRDVQQLRRHLGSLPRLGRAPAPAPTAAPLASLTALLETLRAHADEARRGVAPETSALRLNESVLWGTPEGGWGCVGAADHSAAASSACPASPAAAFLAPLLWQVRLVGAPQGAPPPNWRGAVQRPNSRQPPPAPAWNATARANRMRALGPPRPVAPFISAFSGEDLINDCPSCGPRAAFAFWQHAKMLTDWLNVYGEFGWPFIGIGNRRFPNSEYNQQWLSWQQTLKQLSVPPYVPVPVIQIIIFIIWIVVFIVVQIPAGILELIFWWILNPWWDLLMLTFFAYANALWQTCDACSLHNCPNSQGSGGKSSKCSCVDGKPTCGG